MNGGSPTEVEALRGRVARLEALNTRLVYENQQLQQPQGQSFEPSDEEPCYLASRTRSTFHRPSCEWARYIPTYKLIEFASHREAVEAGYKPCKTCRA